MKATLLNTALVFIIVLNVQNQVLARPSLNSRVKRVSDTHYADAKARNGITKIGGIAITLPIGGGARNLDIIGRKRRSQSRFLETLFNQSEEDQGDPVDYRDAIDELVFDYK